MNNFDSNNIIESIFKKLNSNNLDINDILSKKEGLSAIVEHIINSIINAQREDFLLNHNDSKNGYYNRSDDSYFNLVSNLLIHGRSKKNIKSILFYSI